MALTEVIKQLVDKTESLLTNEKTAREKVFVLAHERLAVWVISMSTYATRQQVDYGQRDAETPENTTMVTWWPRVSNGRSGVIA